MCESAGLGRLCWMGRIQCQTRCTHSVLCCAFAAVSLHDLLQIMQEDMLESALVDDVLQLLYAFSVVSRGSVMELSADGKSAICVFLVASRSVWRVVLQQAACPCYSI